jgi:hypothetical protein
LKCPYSNKKNGITEGRNPFSSSKGEIDRERERMIGTNEVR